jgi:hypothetical protein
MEYESSSNIDYLSNIYSDGEKYFWVLYNGNRYYFDDLGYQFQDQAERALDLKIKEINNEVQ